MVLTTGSVLVTLLSIAFVIVCFLLILLILGLPVAVEQFQDRITRSEEEE